MQDVKFVRYTLQDPSNPTVQITLPANGTLVVKPTSNTTYTLTAYGPGGQTVSVTISVFVW